MTIALIDGDLVAYRCAASAEHDDEGIALIRASRLLQDIISATDSDEIRLFLSGSRNFRYDLYPEYKANRRDMKRPRHLETVREFMVVKWGAEVTDGYEADDALGMAAVKGTTIVSLDKDLKQIAGTHYNFVNGEHEEVSEIEGWKNFYSQLILGDRADNIPGYDGKMRPKWPKFLGEVREGLSGANTSTDMFRLVEGLYQDQQALIRNARLLYIWRKLNDEWQPPTRAEVTSEERPVEEAKLESTPMKPGETSPSTERGITTRKIDGSLVRGQLTDTASPKKRRVRSTST